MYRFPATEHCAVSTLWVPPRTLMLKSKSKSVLYHYWLHVDSPMYMDCPCRKKNLYLMLLTCLFLDNAQLWVNVWQDFLLPCLWPSWNPTWMNTTSTLSIPPRLLVNVPVSMRTGQLYDPIFLYRILKTSLLRCLLQLTLPFLSLHLPFQFLKIPYY